MTDERKFPAGNPPGFPPEGRALTSEGQTLPPKGPTLEDWAARGKRLANEPASGAAVRNPRTSDLPTEPDPSVMNRRVVLKVLAAAAAAPAIACDAGSGGSGGEGAVSAPDQPTANPHALGTPTDPDLLTPVVPWDLVLSDEEMVTAAALADVIIPADDWSPASSSVGAHHFVNEWVSAPYEGQRRDLVLIRGGLVWLNATSMERYGAPFAELTSEQHRAICDEICYLPDALPALRRWARFFDKMRDLVSTGFWTTPEGMADLGYQGNVPLPSFDGPPAEVLAQLGLD